MNHVRLFADGPFMSLEYNRQRVMAETTVQRLLHWGKAPTPSNEHNAQRLMNAVKSIGRKSGWYGMDAKRVLRLNGWSEGLEIAKQYQRQLPSFTMQDTRRQRVWSETGDEFDRDRFDAGFDDCWQSCKRVKFAARPILKLTCAIGGHYDLTAEQLMWMGAAAFSLCDSAESAGYRMEIEAISQTHDTWVGDSRDCVQRIKVKSADEPLDRETTVMALACPAFFRWSVIHARCAMSPDLDMNDGAGCTKEINASLRGDLHMPHAYSFEAAKTAVEGLVQQIEDMATVTA